ncbi:MAG: 4-(cytidine 5'-diphospho)-2-C-methyl-D-erythritol kinase [Litoreibacter sp.]|uniref:4-(cytidine 5'-diphospho)-2-C-methyl-D-erythritol kinase n=1 Tax=Litoreibacter sp. TaxID=1969459 RepID=UPI003299B149
MMIDEFAPAKVNLTLHITGQREDGYHLLDSLVMFASVGDKLALTPAQSLGLSVDGPEGRAVPTNRNSVLDAAALLDPLRSAHIQLTKVLPVASGIGGGTADAAAAYRGLSRLWGIPLASPSANTFTHIAALGADVPVSLFSKTARMSGIGEEIEFHPQLPLLNAVLINPRVEVSTPAVFKSIASKTNPAMSMIPKFATDADFIKWLGSQRNDMQEAAIAQAPIIADVLESLSCAQSCQLARMSGSGATCFGLFPGASSAQDACAAIEAQHPDWWIKRCTLGDASF